MHTQLHSLLTIALEGMNPNKQRYKCKTCLYNFTTNKLERGIDQAYVQLSLETIP